MKATGVPSIFQAFCILRMRLFLSSQMVKGSKESNFANLINIHLNKVNMFLSTCIIIVLFVHFLCKLRNLDSCSDLDMAIQKKAGSPVIMLCVEQPHKQSESTQSRSFVKIVIASSIHNVTNCFCVIVKSIMYNYCGHFCIIFCSLF